MVIDHSVMQSFFNWWKEVGLTTNFWKEKIVRLAVNFILFSSSSAAGANKQGKDLCCSVLSNDYKPVYLISLGRPSIKRFPFPNWLLLTFFNNFVCDQLFVLIQFKHKIRHFVQLNDKFFQIHRQIDNIKKGTVFYMKIRTFLQIVRSGKITASKKANLSINKKIVFHKFKICNLLIPQCAAVQIDS